MLNGFEEGRVEAGGAIQDWRENILKIWSAHLSLEG